MHPMQLKEIGGWSNLKLVERYSHLDPERNKAAFAKLSKASME